MTLADFITQGWSSSCNHDDCVIRTYVSSSRWQGCIRGSKTWSDQSALHCFEQHKISPLVAKEQLIQHSAIVCICISCCCWAVFKTALLCFHTSDYYVLCIQLYYLPNHFSQFRLWMWYDHKTHMRLLKLSLNYTQIIQFHISFIISFCKVMRQIFTRRL